MSKTPSRPPGSDRFAELKKLLSDTWEQNRKQPVYADWLMHEAKGHNIYAELIVLYGLSSDEAWDCCVKAIGLTKSQMYRRRLKETMEAFAEKRK